MKSKKTTKTVTINRRADNGQFTTANYVKKHPKTTVTEHRKVKR